MSDNFLEKILTHKREQNASKAEYFETLKKKMQHEKFSRYHLFKNAVSRPGQVNLIAEIKTQVEKGERTLVSDAELKHLLEVAHAMGLDCLVEVHDERELARALKAGAEIIGVNNRDLSTFDIDLKVSERLIPQIPKDKIIVAESGIKTHNEVNLLKDLGAHAVLIGETFMKTPDMAGKIKEVMHG